MEELLQEAETIKTGYLLEDFRLFHLKDRKPIDYPYHYHDFYKLIWFLSGNVEYHIEGKAYQLKPYDILLVGKGQIHKPFIGTDVPYERYNFYISEHFIRKYSSEDCDLKQCFTLADREGSCVIRLSPGDSSRIFENSRLIEDTEEKKEYAYGTYEKLLLMKLLIEIARCCLDNPDVFHKMATYDHKIVEILHHINGHLKDPLSIDELAEQFYISKYHMMRKFKEETGYSMHQYILEKRILLAREMIQAGVPATTACLECGFHDYSTFHRACRKILGKQPSAC